MEEHARAMEELENNTKSNHISLEIKEKVQSPALDPSLQTSSRHISEPTAFLDIIQQTPSFHQTPMSHFYSKGFVHPNSSESVKTNGLSSPVEKPAEKSPTKIPAPIVLVTKAEEDEDDLEEEVANVQKGLEKVVLTKSEEADDEADDEAEEEEEEEEEADAEGDDEEEAEEEAEEEEEVEENYEMIQIKKVRYWHETNSHRLYKYISEDEVGDLVGKWHNIGGIVTISPV
jgi:hypothetical protein